MNRETLEKERAYLTQLIGGTTNQHLWEIDAEEINMKDDFFVSFEQLVPATLVICIISIMITIMSGVFSMINFFQFFALVCLGSSINLTVKAANYWKKFKDNEYCHDRATDKVNAQIGQRICRRLKDIEDKIETSE